MAHWRYNNVSIEKSYDMERSGKSCCAIHMAKSGSGKLQMLRCDQFATKDEPVTDDREPKASMTRPVADLGDFFGVEELSAVTGWGLAKAYQLRTP